MSSQTLVLSSTSLATKYLTLSDIHKGEMYKVPLLSKTLHPFPIQKTSPSS